MTTPRRLLGLSLAGVALASCSGGGSGYGCILCTPEAWNLGGTVSGLAGSRLSLQNNGVAASVQIAPAANGTYVNLIAGNVAPGTSYNVTVQTQPTNPSQTCVVANGTGTVAHVNVTSIAVTCTTNPGRFVYVANDGSSTVSAYVINPSNGTLTAVAGSPFATGGSPQSLAVDSGGKFVYVGNGADGTISAFAVNTTSGALTSVAGSPFAAGAAPTGVAIDPAGTFLYVTNGGGGTVSAYAIAAGSGALTPVAGSQFIAGSAPSAVSVEPLGRNAYVTNQGDGTVAAYAIGQSGALTVISGSPFAAGLGPRAVAIDPSARYVYVANSLSNLVSAFAVQGNGGAISAISGSPFKTGANPYAVAVDPSDRFVYVANHGSISIPASISVYALGTNGALTAIAGSPFAAGAGPASLAFDPTGKFAYAADSISGKVLAFGVDAASGALTAVAGSPFPAGANPMAIAVSD